MKSSRIWRYPTLDWQAYPSAVWSACPVASRDWLLDSGSLTRRMQALSPHLVVQPLRQGLSCITLDESAYLQHRHSRLAWVREVLLCDESQPWVWARSVLPLGSGYHQHKRLLSLGAQPLGPLLFSGLASKRSAFELATLSSVQLPYSTQIPSMNLWARRSFFTLAAQHKLLIQEIFLPDHPIYR